MRFLYFNVFAIDGSNAVTELPSWVQLFCFFLPLLFCRL